jgi:hypothetical protein
VAETSTNPSATPAGASPESESSPPNRGGLSPEEWSALTEAFELSDAQLDAAAAAAKSAPPHPESLKLRATVTVDAGSAQLLPGGGSMEDASVAVVPLLRAALTSATAGVDAFHSPRKIITLAVGSICADASGVTLIRTALESPSGDSQALTIRY